MNHVKRIKSKKVARATGTRAPARIARKSAPKTTKRTAISAKSAAGKRKGENKSIPEMNSKGHGHLQFTGTGWRNFEMKQAGLTCATDCPGCNE